jgi:O-antigen/teichoic acid export membrane protein
MSLLEPAVGFEAPPRPRPWLAKAWRYGLSTSGPVATSGAHFLASLLFVRNLPPGEFGLFSFVLVIVPFCMSIIGSMAVLPVTCSLSEGDAARARINASCLKLNLVLSAAATLFVFAVLSLAHAQTAPAMLLALFGGLLTTRWFARCFAYVQGRIHRAVASDLIYAVALIGSLGAIALAHRLTFLSGTAALALAAAAGLLPLGRDFAREQLCSIRGGKLRDYAPIFRDLTRWSLLGVALTEATVNAHAYLVTFVSGSGAFALLALGMLVMRPISLVQGALPDLERPVMARAIAANDSKGLLRIQREFLAALLAVWTATVLLAAGLLLWMPQLLLKKGYVQHDVVLVTLCTAAIMMVRNFRTPLAVKLQAAGEFKALAGIGTWSCAVSVTATLILLLTFGPIASLGGIFAGELVILAAVHRLGRQWMARHD